MCRNKLTRVPRWLDPWVQLKETSENAGIKFPES